MADAARRQMTLDEFLVWQEGQDERYEFIDGAPRAMTGATHTHDTITVNILAGLSNALRGKPCRAATADIGVLLPSRTLKSARNLRRPDAMIECSPRMDGMLAHEPVAIFEVLSPSTRVIDQTTKFVEYQALPSLTAYILVQQERPEVSVYRRQNDGAWTIAIISGLDAAIALDDVGITLPLAEIYDRLTFDPSADANVSATG
jgi:Uma2 family endonuclease